MPRRWAAAATTGSTSGHHDVATGTAGRLPTTAPSGVTRTSAALRGVGVTALLFLGVRRHGGAAAWEAREVVLDVEPGDALRRPDVVVDPDFVRIVEAADADLHAIAQRLLAHRHG